MPGLTTGADWQQLLQPQGVCPCHLFPLVYQRQSWSHNFQFHLKCHLRVWCLFFFPVLRMEPRASCRLGKMLYHSATPPASLLDISSQVPLLFLHHLYYHHLLFLFVYCLSFFSFRQTGSSQRAGTVCLPEIINKCCQKNVQMIYFSPILEITKLRLGTII